MGHSCISGYNHADTVPGYGNASFLLRQLKKIKKAFYRFLPENFQMFRLILTVKNPGKDVLPVGGLTV